MGSGATRGDGEKGRTARGTGADRRGVWGFMWLLPGVRSRPPPPEPSDLPTGMALPALPVYGSGLSAVDLRKCWQIEAQSCPCGRPTWTAGGPTPLGV